MIRVKVLLTLQNCSQLTLLWLPQEAFALSREALVGRVDAWMTRYVKNYLQLTNPVLPTSMLRIMPCKAYPLINCQH